MTGMAGGRPVPAEADLPMQCSRWPVFIPKSGDDDGPSGVANARGGVSAKEKRQAIMAIREEREEPQHPKSPGRKPARPPDEAQTSAPSTSNSPSLAHAPPAELDLRALDPYHGVPPDLREELKLRPSPPGVTFTVSGNNTTELGLCRRDQMVSVRVFQTD